MDPKKALPRRMCTSCRKWFKAKPSATTTQKTCSFACQAKRRAMQARQRRERNLQESRVAERERQRACRERRRRSAGSAVAAPHRVMSRATLPREAIGIAEDIMAIVDRSSRLSRASLCRQLDGFLGKKGAILDQAGP